MAIVAGGGGGTPTPTPQTTGSGGAAAAAQAALQAAQAGGGAAQMATPYQIPIRMGDYSRPTNRGQFDDNIHTSGPHTSQLAPLISRFNLDDGGLQQAMGAWYAFDDAERSKIMKKMWFLGLLKDPSDFDGAYRVWGAAVDHASRFAAQGKEMDPRDVLDIMGNATQAEKDRQKARGYAGGTFTQKSTSIDLTDPTTAKAFITAAFQQSMGRDPQDAEIRSMMTALSAQEKANPKVTTTTTKYDDNGAPINSNSTSSGGLNAEAYVSAQASADPEAGAHQAASQLFPALMQALQAPPT